MKSVQIPYYAVNHSFDVVYRNQGTSSPVIPHTHNALEIYFTLTDLPDVLLNDTVSSIQRGSLIIIPPYTVHQLFNQSLTVYERYILSINTIWLSNVFASHPELLQYAYPAGHPRIITLSDDEQAVLCGYLQQFIRNHKQVSLHTYTDFFILLDQINTMVSKSDKQVYPTQLTISKSQEMVNQIIAYLNEHILETLTLASIADHFYMNKDYLARLFKKHTHSTIGHYIAMQKISMAQGLLTDGLTVAQVQEKMGFSSYAYFFQFFKKMTGISPSHYRSNVFKPLQKGY